MQTKHQARVGLPAESPLKMKKAKKAKKQLALGFVVGYNDKDNYSYKTITSKTFDHDDDKNIYNQYITSLYTELVAKLKACNAGLAVALYIACSKVAMISLFTFFINGEF